MKNNKLSELTIEELSKQKNSLNGTLIGISIVMFIAYGILLYLIIKNQKFALIAVIPSGLLTLLPSIIRLNQINSEIKSRLTK